MQITPVTTRFLNSPARIATLNSVKFGAAVTPVPLKVLFVEDSSINQSLFQMLSKPFVDAGKVNSPEIVSNWEELTTRGVDYKQFDHFFIDGDLGSGHIHGIKIIDQLLANGIQPHQITYISGDHDKTGLNPAVQHLRKPFALGDFNRILESRYEAQPDQS